MARQATSPLMAQLRQPSSPAEQIDSLRALKHEIIGHQQRKEMWVGQGALEPVVRALNDNKDIARQNGKERFDRDASHRRALSEAETIRLEAVYIIGSIAAGGPSFVPFLHSASAVPTILQNLCPSKNHPQLVLATLRTLYSIVDCISLSSTPQALTLSILAEYLFSRRNMASLRQILFQSSAAGVVQAQVSISASLISSLCAEERHQLGLANSGVLDALATRLASFAVAQGMVIPGTTMPESVPPPAPHTMNIAAILEAITTIISDSKYRASQFVCSSAIQAVFHRTSLSEIMLSPGPGFGALGGDLGPMDLHLPHLAAVQARNSILHISAFPPLGSSGSTDQLAQLNRTQRFSNTAGMWPGFHGAEGDSSFQDSSISSLDEPESPLVAYLIWLTRTLTGLDRVMAASVLTALWRTGLANKSRETALGLLIVPIIARLLDDDSQPKTKESHTDSDAIAINQLIKERAPAVLATLVTDSEHLQKAAIDAGVVSKLSKMIKVAYDPVDDSMEHRGWSPDAENSSGAFDSSEPSCFPRLLVHKIKVREHALKAIAALVSFKDEYRKALIDQGVVPYIVESLKPQPGKPSSKVHDSSEEAKQESDSSQEKPRGYGTNPVSVLIAASGAVRAISRSVSILRTTLIDNGVAMPVFKLMQHPDVEVQIAATAAVCNLVTDVSPMREVGAHVIVELAKLRQRQTITEAGVLGILCDHAKSVNARLRLNAVWALKHLICSAPNDLKKKGLEELGQGWLVRLICDDQEDEALMSRAKSDVFRRRDADEDEDMDEDMENSDPDMKASYASSQRSKANARLEALRDLETNPERRARNDDVAVQEQALDFIRNFIGLGANGTAETTEMIDTLLSALGQDQLFDILASKLRSKIINPFNKRTSSSIGETRVLPPPPEIITAVIMILVHMAASIPRHRQLVIAQTELLKLLVPQFQHPSKEVRIALCHLLTNLTWREDQQGDGHASVQRANELKSLGFMEKLKALQNDVELDVRERAKPALWQMSQGFLSQ